MFVIIPLYKKASKFSTKTYLLSNQLTLKFEIKAVEQDMSQQSLSNRHNKKNILQLLIFKISLP